MSRNKGLIPAVWEHTPLHPLRDRGWCQELVRRMAEAFVAGDLERYALLDHQLRAAMRSPAHAVDDSPPRRTG